MSELTVDEIHALVEDVSTDIIYLADMDTYKLYYMNSTLLELLDNPPEIVWKNSHCYELLQGRNAPCEFCTNSVLKTDTSSLWTQYNPKFQSWITHKDKKIEFKGKNLRLEVARNISDNIEVNEILHDLMEEKRILIDCVKLLESQSPPHISIHKLLKLIASFHDADRAYILEYSENKKIANHAFEYCKQGVASQIHMLHDLDFSGFEPFLQSFEKRLPYRVKDVETDQDMIDYPICQNSLRKFEITSILMAPIISHDGAIVGLLGVDNPRLRLYAQSVLSPLSTFIADCLERQKLTEKLFTLSYSDSMTKLKNSHAFLEAHHTYETTPPRSIGIAYIDINGLKQVNDSLGHEEGNKLIIILGDLLYDFFKEEAYRIGGDEFVILSPDCTDEEFRDKIVDIREEIDNIEKLHVAIGTSWTNDLSDGIKKFIEVADRAMYHNKKDFYSSKGFDRRRPR